MSHDSVVTPAASARSPLEPAPAEPLQVRRALDEVLQSHTFSTSERLRRFLRYIVEETLAGRADGLKEYAIATEVCDRPADFDPRIDPVVRVEARRLRARLADYYAKEGRDARVVLSVPKGGYVPLIEVRPEAARPADRPVAPGSSPAGPAVAAERRPPVSPRGEAPPGEAAAPGHRDRLLWWPLAAAIAVIATGVLAWWSLGGTAGGGPASGVAVLPFQNVSADPENEHFCFGLVEDLTAALSEVRGLRVVARTSAAQAVQGADLQQAAARLRVRYVVEGSVRRDGPRLRVTARLVDTRDGSPVWSDTYDRQLADVFGVQGELARVIAGALVPTLGLRPEPLRERRGPASAEAHGLFLKGQFLARTKPGTQAQAERYLLDAIAADPTYPPAHLELAAIHATLALDSLSPPEREVALAREGVERALALDPTLADAIALKAWIRFFSDRDWDGAEQLFREALAINPSSSVAHHRYALLLMTAGRFDKAIEHGRQALDLDPLSYRLVNGCAVIYFCARQYVEAERLARESTVLAPDFFLAHLILGSTLVAQRRIDEGIAAYRAALAVQPHDPDATASLGRALALAGRHDEARALLAALEAPDAPRPPSRYELAFLLAALGERDRAFAELELSLARHETELLYLGVDPLFDPLRGDSRFDAVLRAVGVPGR